MLHALSMVDNHSHMVGSCQVLHPESGCPACPACGWRIDPDYTDPAFRLRQNRDISTCYDGAIIVSQRFRDLAASFGNAHLVYTPLPRAPGKFHLKSARPLVFDLSTGHVRRAEHCAACDLYRSVHGNTPPLAAGQGLPANGVNLSDFCFGSYNEAQRMLVADEGFVLAFRATKMTGLNSTEPLPA